MRYVIGIIFFLGLSIKGFADSPLTSVSFWKNSQNPLVQRTGSLKGKKKLNNKMYRMIVDPHTDLLDKITLINAISWEFDSKVSNSNIFLNKIKKECGKFITRTYKEILKADSIGWYSDDKHFDITALTINGKKQVYKGLYFESADDFLLFYSNFSKIHPRDIISFYSTITDVDYFSCYLSYLYLRTMDSYNDVSDVMQEFIEFERELKYNYDMDDNGELKLKYLNFEKKEIFYFLKFLISSQASLINDQISCSVWEKFIEYTNKDCISNLALKKYVYLLGEYLKSYSKYCSLNSKTSDYYISSYCNSNLISIIKGQEVHILHYPVFIYGKLTVYDRMNRVILDYKIDGDDYVRLLTENYDPGDYTIKLLDSETSKSYLLKLIVN
jgi:hypothetical protein